MPSQSMWYLSNKKIIKGKQCALTWHVDDAKASCADSKVNDEFYEWDKKKHGSDELGHASVTRGKRHDYLGAG